MGERVVGMFWVSCMVKYADGKSSTVSNGYTALGKGVGFSGVCEANLFRYKYFQDSQILHLSYLYE